MIVGIERLHPRPNGPLPDPESYESESCGPNPERPGLAGSGTDNDAVPVAGLTANFSPMPRIAPPPLGIEIEGIRGLPAEVALLLSAWLLVAGDLAVGVWFRLEDIGICCQQKSYSALALHVWSHGLEEVLRDS